MSDTPRVFIPQHPATFDAVLKTVRHDSDLSPVLKFGSPIFMLPAARLWPRKMDRTVKTLEDAMFDFKPTDYLLATGDVLAVAAALAIAIRRTGGNVQMIRYFRKSNEFKTFVMRIGANVQDQG